MDALQTLNCMHNKDTLEGMLNRPNMQKLQSHCEKLRLPSQTLRSMDGVQQPKLVRQQWRNTCRLIPESRG